MLRSANPFLHTFSIVARDPVTGQMAVGVQSHWFCVGKTACWAEAGVGAIVTQSFVNVSFGMEGLQLLRQGKSPQEVLQELVHVDEAQEYRQVAILDRHGKVAAFTGENCVDYAGHTTGKGFSVQANMMVNDKVWPAMARAYEKNKQLPLAERVLSALKAAQTAGGDLRGQQSAALLIVNAEASAQPWNDTVLDLRVDDHQEPLEELERLLSLYRAYEHMNLGDQAVAKGNLAEAQQEYRAAEDMVPYNLEMQYWHAISLANVGKTAEASAMLKKIYKKDPVWQELTRRLPKAGLLAVAEKDLEKLMGS